MSRGYSHQVSKWVFPLTLAVFSAWGVHFIVRTSATGLDGKRYWILFDDAMISMRYALHLANGYGLTWNPGEHVEGFTNPLWTTLMAAAIRVFGKFYAPLAIQILGLLLVIGAAVLTKQCTDRLMGENSFWSNVASILVLAYYPLWYWSLAGMEVSALALCTAFVLYISICKPNSPNTLTLIYTTLCIAYLIRPDGFVALLPALVIQHKLSLAGATSARNRHLKGILSFIAVVAFVTVLRYSYYGELVPNTYTLKVTGYPLNIRLKNGLRFVKPFIDSTLILWLLYGIVLLKRRQNNRSFLVYLGFMPILATGYQIYVGGDPWNYWRQLAPSVIPLIIVGVLELNCLMESLHLPKIEKWIGSVVAPVLIIALLDYAFVGEMFRGKPYQFAQGEKLVHISNLLDDVLVDGRILVFWSGIIPYYYDHYAIDALGKTDKYIASLPPNYDVNWSGMRGVPGHAKHSLAYSLNKDPDFLQYLRWYGDYIGSDADRHFVAINYKGTIACLKRDSEHVRWNLVEKVGLCSQYTEKLF